MVLDWVPPERWFRYPGLEVDTSMRLRQAEDDLLFSQRNFDLFAASVPVRKCDQKAAVREKISPESAWMRSVDGGLCSLA